MIEIEIEDDVYELSGVCNFDIEDTKHNSNLNHVYLDHVLTRTTQHLEGNAPTIKFKILFKEIMHSVYGLYFKLLKDNISVFFPQELVKLICSFFVIGI